MGSKTSGVTQGPKELSVTPGIRNIRQFSSSTRHLYCCLKIQAIAINLKAEAIASLLVATVVDQVRTVRRSSAAKSSHNPYILHFNEYVGDALGH